MQTFINAKWAVCYDIDGTTQDDKQTKRTIDAVLTYPHLAQDYIDKCLPAENRGRFYIRHMDDIERGAM